MRAGTSGPYEMDHLAGHLVRLFAFASVWQTRGITIDVRPPFFCSGQNCLFFGRLACGEGSWVRHSLKWIISPLYWIGINTTIKRSAYSHTNHKEKQAAKKMLTKFIVSHRVWHSAGSRWDGGAIKKYQGIYGLSKVLTGTTKKNVNGTTHVCEGAAERRIVGCCVSTNVISNNSATYVCEINVTWSSCLPLCL